VPGTWWWCTTHEVVEPNDGCPNAVRLGPYESAKEAEHAVELAHERTEAWEAEDRAWERGTPNAEPGDD
jgi:hypothetical protein